MQSLSQEAVQEKMRSKVIPTMDPEEIQLVFNRTKDRTANLLNQIFDQRQVIFNKPLEQVNEHEVDRLLNLCSEAKDCMGYSLYIINNLDGTTPELDEYRDAINTILEEVASITSGAHSSIA